MVRQEQQQLEQDSTQATLGQPSDQTAAQRNRQFLASHGIFGLCMIGGPGSGKTSLIETTVRRLAGELNVMAIIANPTAKRDAARLESCCHVLAIEGEQLFPEQLEHLTDGGVQLLGVDLLILEHQAPVRVGGCADLGQDAVVAVFSAAGGDDKAASFPHQVAGADLVLLSKADLLPHVNFDQEVFGRDVAHANPYARIMEISTRGLVGIEQWILWLRQHVEIKRQSQSASGDVTSEWFFG